MSTEANQQAVATGVVTAWEPELAAQARQFAAAHGRRFVERPAGATVDEFVEEVRSAVSLTVFVSAGRMIHAFLHAIIQASVRRRLSVGLVPCTPDSQVPLAPPPHDPLPRRSPLFSYFHAGDDVPGEADTYGRPGWEAFLAASEAGAEAMILHTHSNGADAPFGGAILCARVDGRLRAARLVRCLPCHADGPCIREPGHEFSVYFGPSRLRCHALVLLSCTGFPPADSLLQYEASLAHAALRGGTIRSIVTSIRIAGSTTLPLAIGAKRYLEAGATMGTLALAINLADTASLPHYVCIGDPEHRPIDGPIETGRPCVTAEPQPSDLCRPQRALVALAEAELLARAEPVPWSAIEARIRFLEQAASTAAHVPVADPPRLVGDRVLSLERLAERVEGEGRCPSCDQPTERRRAGSGLAREDLVLERCPTHGITVADAAMPTSLDELPASRAARWLFTALTLRQLQGQLESRAAEALDVARGLERRALASDVDAPLPRELDLAIASLFGASVGNGGEAFLTRQLRYVSTSHHGTVEQLHACGRPLLFVDLSPIPLRIRRRLWFCPLCGVVGHTLRELDLPELVVEAGRWRSTPMRAPFAPDGCALTLVWEARGLRRDDWTTTIWLDGPRGGELPLAHRDVAGLRHLDGVMVADGEVFSVRVPVLVAWPDGRAFSLRELNDEDHAASLSM